ncbi:MAG: hypothetical protein IJ011_00715 [Clostridia bacterium]|nr:hypothetical protein [Clostridia bacterium]
MKDPFRKFKKKGNPDQDDSIGENVDEHKFITFAKKIGNYFNTEPQKEKVLRHEDFNAAGDVYYASVSAHYKVAQRVLVLLLVFFLVFSIITNFREITFDNFYYLIKDFTSAADVGTNNYETLSYESDSRQHFVLYRGGIATVSPSKISIFTATGRRTLNETSEYSSPFAVSSDKYVLFFDTAGTKFSLYNSFARVYNEELDSSVKFASLGEDGSFAIVTGASTGYWNIRIYTKNFAHKATLTLGNYIFGIDLDSDQKKLSVLSYELGNGTGRTVLSVYDLSKMRDDKGNEITLEKKMSFDGEFPVKCGFMKNGCLALITDSSVRVFDKTYEEKNSTVDYSNGELTGYFIGKEGVAVSVMQSASSKLLAYDGLGNMLYDKSVSYNVSDVSICDSKIFLKVDQGVVKIDPANGNRQQLESGSGKMLIYNSKTALVCGESKAEYLIFN